MKSNAILPLILYSCFASRRKLSSKPLGDKHIILATMPPGRSEPSRLQRSFSARLILTAVALALWFWTQSLIGARPSPASGIGDAIHNATAFLIFFWQNPGGVPNPFLFLSSLKFAFRGVFFLSLWFF